MGDLGGRLGLGMDFDYDGGMGMTGLDRISIFISLFISIVMVVHLSWGYLGSHWSIASGDRVMQCGFGGLGSCWISVSIVWSRFDGGQGLGWSALMVEIPR